MPRVPARRQREVRQPDYIARAKVGNGWVSIGAAWNLRSGEDGFSLRLTTVPVGNWDGRFVLLRPLSNDEPAEEESEAAYEPATVEALNPRRRRKPDEDIPL